jgi:hypothetical protein
MTSSPEQNFQPLPAAAVTGLMPHDESSQHFSQVPPPPFSVQQFPHQHDIYSTAPPPASLMASTSAMTMATPFMTSEHHQHAFQFPASNEPFYTT